MARTTTAKKNTKKTAAKNTTSPRTRPTPRPRASLPTRTRHWMTDLQGYATLAARLAGITTPNIQAWHDHRDGTTTRQLDNGATLHYQHNTRTLTRQAPCPMGATHEHVLHTPADTDTAQTDTDTCTSPHWAAPAADTGTHLAARLHTAIQAAADTQPLSMQEIADGLTARIDADQPKEHPKP